MQIGGGKIECDLVPMGGPHYLRMELYTKYATITVPNAGNDIARRQRNHLQSIASLRNTVSVRKQYILNFIQFPENPAEKDDKSRISNSFEPISIIYACLCYWDESKHATYNYRHLTQLGRGVNPRPNTDNLIFQLICDANRCSLIC